MARHVIASIRGGEATGCLDSGEGGDNERSHMSGAAAVQTDNEQLLAKLITRKKEKIYDMH